MRNPSKAAAGFLAALCVACPSSRAAADDIERWQELARTDLDAVHQRILEGHPGVIDLDNPRFKDWVERGYGEARQLLPHVMSYDTALAVVRYYTAGFEDGHLGYSDDIREDFPIHVSGWNVTGNDDRYVVATAMPDWPARLPPLGATWLGCDGLTAEQVLATRIAPFTDRRSGRQAEEHRSMALAMKLPLAENLRECSFRTPSGELLKLPVAYQAIGTDQFFAALPSTRDGGKRSANAFSVQDGVLWVRAGNFNLRSDSSDQHELEAMLQGLQSVSGVSAIVFDVRGNGGGDSGIGDRIFEAATGGLEYDRVDMESLPRYYAQWRVSERLVQFLDDVVASSSALYGSDSPRVAEDIAFRDEVAAAKANGDSWVEQDAGYALTREIIAARNGHLRRFKGPVALLTDASCVSACLDFADLVLRVPGAKQLGQPTGADSVYMVGSRSTLPSGNRLVMPVKVWRNRPRGNNEPHVPELPIDLSADESTIRRDVLHALGVDPPPAG